MRLEEILLHIIESTEGTESQRKDFVSSILMTATSEQGFEEAAAVYSICWNRIVNDSKQSPLIPLHIISVYGKKYPDSLKHFATCDRISLVLNVNNPDKFVRIIAILKEILQALHGDDEYMSSISSISVKLEEKFTEFGTNPQILSLLSDLYRFCPILLPPTDKRLAFTKSIMHHVASFQTPTKTEVVKYMKSIGLLVTQLWESMQLNDILASLFSMYELISSVEMKNVCPAMAHLVSLIPPGVVESLSPRLIASSGNNAFTATLNRLTTWIVAWPTAYEAVSHWIKTLVRLLYQAGRQVVPVNITNENLPKLLLAVRIPVCQQGIIAVVTTLLMSFQMSHKLFHFVIPQLIGLIEILKKDDSLKSKGTLDQLILLCHCQMTMHSGYPDKYQELMQALSEFPSPSEEKVSSMIKEYDWVTPVKNQLSLVNKSISKLVGPGDLMSYHKRRPGDKTGLSNLGNTCYMNSVIQALFMTDEHHILYSEPQTNRKLLRSLQKLFALLSFSDRSYAAPRQFHDESRPPWFSAGTQQDCSEYCRHLLVTLHEEERDGQKLPDYQERMVIESETASLASDLQAPSEDLFPVDSVTKCMEYDMSETSMECMDRPYKSDDGTLKRKVPCDDDFLAKVSKAEVTNGSKDVDSSSDSGISGDLTEDMDVVRSPSYNHFPQESTSEFFQSAVQNVFGGKISTSIKCLQCKTESIHKDTFTDINLAFEDSDHCNLDSIRQRQGKSELTLDDMMRNYLKTETLSGDNQYECEKCKQKQDAERSIRILQAPDHLILTQLRFYYDTSIGQRHKVFTKVNFSEYLSLPVYVAEDKSENGSCTGDEGSIVWEKYALYGVVVHSGTTSDGGHYYCYARNSTIATFDSELQQRFGIAGNWHNFNDDIVTPTSFSVISRFPNTFIRDTPYILFYKKITHDSSSYDEKSMDRLEKLPTEVRDFVRSHNLSKDSNLGSYSVTMSRNRDPNDKPPPPSGGCGSRGYSNITSREIF